MQYPFVPNQKEGCPRGEFRNFQAVIDTILEIPASTPQESSWAMYLGNASEVMASGEFFLHSSSRHGVA